MKSTKKTELSLIVIHIMSEPQHIQNASSRQTIGKIPALLSGLAGNMLLMSVMLTFIAAVALLFAGLPIGAAWPAAIGISIAMFWKNSQWRSSLSATGLILLLWVAAIFLGLATADPTYDGNNYHQVTEYLFSEGWNPFLHGVDADKGLAAVTESNTPEGISLWVKCYAISMELSQGVLVAIFGSIEVGKAINYILLVSLVLVTYSFLRQTAGQSKKAALITSLAVALNPVCYCQAFTFYIDFLQYIVVALIIILVASIAAGHAGWRGYAMLAAVIIFGADAKFTNFLWEGLAVVCSVAFIYFRISRKKALKIALLSFGAALVAFFVTGRHPYVTNWITHGHPLFPLMGDGAVDIMTHNTPECYSGHGRVYNFFLSQLSFSQWSEVIYDSRRLGFGLLFLPLLCLSLYAVISGRKLFKGGLLYGWICIFLSVFLIEQCWWARYVCHIWLLIPLGMVAAERSGKMRYCFLALALGAILPGTILLVRNCLDSAALSLHHAIIVNRLPENKVRVTDASPANCAQLRWANLDPVITDTVAEGDRPIYWNDAGTAILVDSATYNEIIPVTHVRNWLADPDRAFLPRRTRNHKK